MDKTEKMPPVEKIYEAYSAIADGRVKMEEDHAEVASSDGKKTYTVSWQDKVWSSSDNASWWQGYPGYPVIAVLMLQGKLSLDRQIAGEFAGVDWKQLNDRHRRDYSKAVEYIMSERSLDNGPIAEEVGKVYGELERLGIVMKRGKIRPPK